MLGYSRNVAGRSWRKIKLPVERQQESCASAEQRQVDHVVCVRRWCAWVGHVGERFPSGRANRLDPGVPAA